MPRKTWKKTVKFITNTVKRRRYDADNIRQLRYKVTEWNKKTKAPIACFVYYRGRVNFITSPDLRGLAQNEEIQKSIAEFICKSGAVRDDDEILSERTGRIDIPVNWKMKNTAFLRDLVLKIVTHNGKRKPYWGLQSRKPYWWPNNVSYVSPKNNRAEGRPKKEALVLIVEAFMASNTAQEVDNEDDSDEENDEIEEICDAINSKMTAAEGAQILQHMASMAWTKMRGCAQQIAEKALGVCKTLIPKEKEQIPITERHLVIWERCSMPSNLGKLEPVEVTKDECSLFRSVARVIFQDETFWLILKVGSIAFGIAQEELLIEKIEEGNFPLGSHANYQEMFRDHISNSLLEFNNESFQYSVVEESSKRCFFCMLCSSRSLYSSCMRGFQAAGRTSTRRLDGS